MKVIGIGVDIEKIERFKSVKEALLKRIFTEGELAFCLKTSNRAQHLTARFCAKEAAFKALPFKEIAFKKMEVICDTTGKPSLIIHDDRAKGLDIKLSLSHTLDTAVAFVIVSEE